MRFIIGSHANDNFALRILNSDANPETVTPSFRRRRSSSFSSF